MSGAIATEHTDAGEQRLVTGVRPITLAHGLMLRAAAPITPKRNRQAEQKPCDVGLFDQAARDQLDLIAAIRTAQNKPSAARSPSTNPRSKLICNCTISPSTI